MPHATTTRTPRSASSRAWRYVSALCVGLVGLAVVTTLRAAEPSVPIAVIGDSDSHAFHDDVGVTGEALRVGAYHASTWQWTELLTMLRPTAVDFGPWGVFGVSPRVAHVLHWFGIHRPMPRKRDYRQVFAWSGAGCESITNGWSPQLTSVLRLLEDDPTRWSRGLVVIRIGVNDFGQTAHLEALATGAGAARVQAAANRCLTAMLAAIGAIHRANPSTGIVVVGAQDNTHWPRNHKRWQNAKALARIRAVLDGFDREVRTWAAQDARLAFFDDRAWIEAQWGRRDANGRPSYHDVTLGGRTRISSTEGNAPMHAVVADGHGGTVYNGLWAQAFVQLVNARFGTRIPPLTARDIATMADPKGVLGL